MLHSNEGNRLPFILIIILVLFHIVNNVIIGIIFPHTWAVLGGEIKEEIELLDTKSQIASTINKKIPLYRKVNELSGLLNTPSQRPKMAHIISASAALMFGQGNSVYVISALYYLLLILGTYLVAVRLFDKNTGLFAAFLVSLYPNIFEFSRAVKNVDFALASFFIFALYLLLCTEDFSKSGRSIIFGFFLGLGILIKGSILIFLLTPLLFSLFRLLRNKPRQPKPILNFIFALAIAAFISSLWWRGYLGEVFCRFRLYLEPKKVALLADSPFFAVTESYRLSLRLPETVVLLFKELTIASSAFLSLIFIAGICLFLKMRKNLIMVIWLIVPLAIVSFSALKQGRYFMPILPLMAIITSAGLFEVSDKTVRKTSFILVCMIALTQFFALSYARPIHRFSHHYKKIYSEYEGAAKKFTDKILQENKAAVNLVFISETFAREHNLLLMFEYLMMKSGLKNADLLQIQDMGSCDFAVLLFDRAYFLRIAFLLSEERKRSPALQDAFLYEKYSPWEDNREFYEIFGNPEKYDYAVFGITQLFRQKKEIFPLEIYEKLLVLEAIKRKTLDIKTIQESLKDFSQDILLWSGIYNEKGINGLIQDLTLSYEEFVSLLEKGNIKKPLLRDQAWNRLYKGILESNFTLLEHGKIPSLGLDFYLFKRNEG